MPRAISIATIFGTVLLTTPVFAHSVESAPPLPEYYAYPAPPPPLAERVRDTFWWVKHFYISGLVGQSFIKVGDIHNDTPPPLSGTTPPVIDTDEDASVTHYGAAIGYRFRKSGIFSRVEVNYLYRSSFNYNENPFLKFSPVETQLNSKITNQTLLFKIFYDMDFDSYIIPYIQGGAGVAFNKVSAHSESKINFIPPLIVSKDSRETTTNLAWDAGLGVRVPLGRHVFLGVGYEFDWLGKLKWETASLDPKTPFKIKADHLYSNSVTFDFTLEA